MIQAILFPRSWTTKKARKWLKDHNYKAIKRVHKTDKFLRYRIRKPKKSAKYRIIPFGKNIKAIYEVSKKNK